MSTKNYVYGGIAAVGTFVAFPLIAATGLAAFGYTSTGKLITMRNVNFSRFIILL
jgi:hypothetical protein